MGGGGASLDFARGETTCTPKVQSETQVNSSSPETHEACVFSFNSDVQHNKADREHTVVRIHRKILPLRAKSTN